MCPEKTPPDLGDDLLEPTRFSPRIGGAVGEEASADEHVKSAEILLGEGLTEEAKKLLHRVLIGDSAHPQARELLHKIHDDELKHILEGRERRARPMGARSSVPPTLGVLDPDEVLRRLDQDLKLGLEDRPLFAELADRSAAHQEFVAQLEAQMADASVSDRLDMGLGFFQMDLYELALAQWESALKLVQTERERMVLCALQALALILLRRPFEASACLQPVLGEQDIPWSEKTELVYLMARSAEAQGDLNLAASWYEQVASQDPLYRDALRRWERLKSKK